ncbi:methyltransferase, FxLD system [Streptacidiphilus albus]|uniref:methyltransferase, FxLD system n=1 Tax=Streptacidiphilus albus TaxID=105425 RepID=UPI00054C55E1|nr:methyltransferase, FxLD system [Streptacidiphilus albus]
MSPSTLEDDAARLREEMIRNLKESGDLTSPVLEAALRKIPRHEFAPEATLEKAYSWFEAVPTRTDEYGVTTSSVSAPQIQAFMLEQAGVTTGMNVLEIGSGGYNAALIAELVGPTGQVTTIDIDPEVTERATRLLKEHGYDSVRVVTGDAAAGVPDRAPFDAILVTAGAWDIAPAWLDQLTGDGVLVLPLRVRGLTRSIAFARHSERLESRSVRVCGFVPMQGEDEHPTQVLLVAGTDEIGLKFDDEVTGNPGDLDNAVRTERFEEWTGVEMAPQEPFNTLQLWLASHLSGYCTMAVDPDLDTGIVAPANKHFSMAAVKANSFGYITSRRTDKGNFEFGVHALGPQAHELACDITQQIRTWDREQRRGPGPTFAVFPAGTPDEDLSGDWVFDKRHSRITISWPEAKPQG